MKVGGPSTFRLRAFLAIAVAGVAVYFYAIHGVAAAVYWDVCVAVMLAAGFAVASRLDRHRSAWMMILVGQACFLTGDV